MYISVYLSLSLCISLSLSLFYKILYNIISYSKIYYIYIYNYIWHIYIYMIWLYMHMFFSIYVYIYIYIRVSMSKPFWISPTFRQNQQCHRYFRPHLAAPSSSRDHSWKLHRKPFLADNLWWFYAVDASKHSGVLQKVYANSLRYLKPEWISKTHTTKKHTRWCPPVISWFISPLTIDISPINHSYGSYKPT